MDKDFGVSKLLLNDIRISESGYIYVLVQNLGLKRFRFLANVFKLDEEFLLSKQNGYVFNQFNDSVFILGVSEGN